MRRLLTIAHSYSVALNRRLAHELSRARAGKWEVIAAAPAVFHGDFAAPGIEAEADEPCTVRAIPTHLSKRVHLMLYGTPLRDLLRERWNLVHCWEEPYVLAAAQVARWTPRPVPLVLTTYQNLNKSYPPPFRWTELYAIRRAAAWIAGGRTIEQAVAQRPGYRERPYSLIPLGVDMETFRPDARRGQAAREELGWSGGGPPVVGYLGRFVEEKGLPLLLRALENTQSPWRALFVGAGPLENWLRAWCARRGDQARVVTGVGHARVPAYLNAMDLLCAPSQTIPRWREQLGRMLIEAFASGVPVIASDSGEIPFVAEGAGIVAPEADADAWQATIERVLGDPGERRRLSAAGLDRAAEVYAWPRVAQRHWELFDTVAA